MRNKVLIGLFVISFLAFPFQSQATVTTTTSKVIYAGDGYSVNFSFLFNIYTSTDLTVQEESSGGVFTTLTLNSDYTVALTHAAPSPGSITLSSFLPIGTSLVILRKLPLTQTINIADNSPTPAATWNQGYDRACMIEQQLQEQINRSILQNPLVSTPITMPAGVANYLLGWDSTGTTLTNIASTGGAGLIPVPIPDSDLQVISSTGKVLGSALASLASIPGSAGTIPAANLGSVAQKGANSDITSLAGLTTPLSAAQGGTGSTHAINAASGVVVLDANSKIPVSQYGTIIDKSSNYGDQVATTDGDVHAWIVAPGGGGASVCGWTNGTNVQCDSSPANADAAISFSVKKGETWNCTMAGSPSVSVSWRPLGS